MCQSQRDTYIQFPTIKDVFHFYNRWGQTNSTLTKTDYAYKLDKENNGRGIQSDKKPAIEIHKCFYSVYTNFTQP